MVPREVDAATEFLDAAPAPPVAVDTQMEMETWSLVPLTQETTKVALDAVRCQANYGRTVSARICLHSINSIRKRSACGNTTSYLYSVDGCESSQIVESGRCSASCHQPSTYELQLTQTATGSEIFIVQSICKTAERAIVEDSSLNFSTNVKSVFRFTAGNLEQRDDNAENLEILRRVEAQEIDLSSDASSYTGSQSTETPQNSVQPLAYQAEPRTTATSQTEKAATIESANVIAIIGIAIVSVSTIAIVLAFAMGRWRARASAAKGPPSQAYSLARATVNSSENSIALTGTDSVAANTHPASEMTGFFI